MKAIFNKLIKDSGFRKVKVFYLWLALLIACFGISTVYFVNIMVKKDFQVNYAKSDPAHIVLTYSSDHSLDLEALREISGISHIENRPMTSGEIQVRKDRFMHALFIGVENIRSPNVNKFEVQKDREQNVDIYIEQNGTYFFDSAHLEKSILIGHQNDTISMGKVGFVHDTRLPPSRMEHAIYVFIPLEKFQQLFPEARKRLVIRTVFDPSQKERLQKIAQGMQISLEEKYNVHVSVNLPSQDHPHQNIADGIFYLVKLLGGSLALMGGVFLILILLTWLYPQIPDMGTLKSLGAGQREILSTYLAFVLLISILALVPATILAYLAAKAFNAFIAFTQNFEPVPYPISMAQFLFISVVCLTIPVLLSLVPLLKTLGKSTRHAQNRVFATHEPTIRWFNVLLPSASAKYIGNNLIKNGTLFVLTTILVVMGLAITYTGYNLSHSLRSEMDNLSQDKLFDYAIELEKTFTNTLNVNTLPGNIEKIDYVYAEVLSIYKPESLIPSKLSCARISPHVFIPQGRMIRGQWKAGCTDCLYFSQRFKQDMAHLEIGESIKTHQADGEESTLTFGGIIKFPENTSDILRPIQEISQWNQLYLHGKRLPDQSAVLKEYSIQNLDLKSHLTSASLTQQIIVDHLEGSFFIITLLGMTALIMSIIGIVLVVNLNLLRRERDIGILKSIGASPMHIKSLFEREVFLVLGLAVLLGSMVSLSFSQSLCYYFGDMVLKFPLILTVDILKAISSVLIYGLIIIFVLRWQIGKRLVRQTRFLLG